MTRLSKIKIDGFRSIKHAEIECAPLTVLIGANGAGKSNLIDFFRMLNYMQSRGFQQPYLTDRGPASHVLHFGPKTTQVIQGELEFVTDRGSNFYRFSLAHVRQDDAFIFTNEEVQFQSARPIPLGPGGHRESGLAELWSENEVTVRFIKGLLMRCRVFQFHDTSVTSHLRGKPFAEEARYFYSDGGNLAAILLRLREESPAVYKSIVQTLRLILPWFEDFILEKEGPTGRQMVPLRWRMGRKGDYDFVAGQLSDGSLRTMALVTLLHLPEGLQPSIMIIDEPELGLHPSAEEIIAGLIRAAAREVQIILSTQSATFVDHFEANHIVVVENEGGRSTFSRQSSDKLAAWLQRYTLGQVWNKNLIGGRP